MKTKQFSVWVMPTIIEQNKSINDDNGDDERRRDRFNRYRAAYQNLKCCCCPCSCPVLAGVLIGALISGIALATVLSIYLVDSSKTNIPSTDGIRTTTITLTTDTTVTTTSSTATTASTSTTSTSTSTSASTTSVTSTTVSTTTSVTTTTATTTTTTAPYCTTRVTFDDIPGQSDTSGVVPNGYNNLNWTNVQYLNASTMPPSGYQMVATSQPFVGYNPGGGTVAIRSANGTRFAFNSILLSSAWRDSLSWTFYGYRAGISQGSASFLINSINRTKITCGGCSNWDTIFMTTSGGIPRSGLAQNGTEFGFDDLCISFGY